MMTSDASDLTFTEIQDDRDELLLPWLDLFEAAFPVNERIPASAILRYLQDKGRGVAVPVHFLAGLSQGRLVSMACYNQMEENAVSFLWYLAVQPGVRGMGAGSHTYQYLLERSRGFARMLMFDVEQIDLAVDETDRRLRERRIAFYQRMGAKRLCGVDYAIRVNPLFPPLPMYLMIHPLASLSPEEAYERALRSLDPGLLKAIDRLELV